MIDGPEVSPYVERYVPAGPRGFFGLVFSKNLTAAVRASSIEAPSMWIFIPSILTHRAVVRTNSSARLIAAVANVIKAQRRDGGSGARTALKLFHQETLKLDVLRDDGSGVLLVFAAAQKR